MTQSLALQVFGTLECAQSARILRKILTDLKLPLAVEYSGENLYLLNGQLNLHGDDPLITLQTTLQNASINGQIDIFEEDGRLLKRIYL